MRDEQNYSLFRALSPSSSNVALVPPLTFILSSSIGEEEAEGVTNELPAGKVRGVVHSYCMGASLDLLPDAIFGVDGAAGNEEPGGGGNRRIALQNNLRKVE